MNERQKSEPAAKRRLAKGDIVRVKIGSLASGGEGVSREFSTPIFISRVAPGDLAEVRLFDVRKDFARAELLQLLESSPMRAEPPCKLFKVCGGCQWQHLSYDHQLEQKTDIVKQAVTHIGRLPSDVVVPAIGANDPLYYRNKVQFPVAQVQTTGRVLAGYYKQNSHELVNIKHCPIQPAVLDRVLESVKASVEKQQLSIYDERTHQGLLRHIIARHSRDNGRVLVTLVINAKSEQLKPVKTQLESIAAGIMQSVAEVVGVCVNFNPARGNRIIGDTTICVGGADHITEVLRSNLSCAPARLKEGIQYKLSSTSFFQVNSQQASILLDEVLLAATGTPATAGSLKRIPVVIDAYAGVGTMALWLATVADRVIGIEEWPGAVADGNNNKALNGFENVEFVQGKVEHEVPRLIGRHRNCDVVVVDPPRKGLQPEALAALCGLSPSRMVYVSCNPTTLARDLRILQDSGYKTKRIQPVDMFPQTYHIESVTVLERQ